MKLSAAGRCRYARTVKTEQRVHCVAELTGETETRSNTQRQLGDTGVSNKLFTLSDNLFTDISTP